MVVLFKGVLEPLEGTVVLDEAHHWGQSLKFIALPNFQFTLFSVHGWKFNLSASSSGQLLPCLPWYYELSLWNCQLKKTVSSICHFWACHLSQQQKVAHTHVKNGELQESRSTTRVAWTDLALKWSCCMLHKNRRLGKEQSRKALEYPEVTWGHLGQGSP